MNHYEYLRSLDVHELAKWIAGVENGRILPDDYICGVKGRCAYSDQEGNCCSFDETGEYCGCVYTEEEKIRMWLLSEYSAQ